MKFVRPQIIRLAYTKLDPCGQADLLKAVGAPDWSTDALSDGEALIEVAGRVCYRSWAPGLNPNVTRTRQGNAAYIGNLIAQNHLSVLEHASVTYGLVNVSRVLTHELVRHRHLSFSQESLRYVRLTDLGAYLPDAFRDHPDAIDILREVFDHCEYAQRELARLFDLDGGADFGRKKEVTSAMRRCAPIGLTTSIVVSGNLRSWREVIEKRSGPHVEEEIRGVVAAIASDLKALFPHAMENVT